MLEPYIVLDFTDERGELGPMLMGDLGADVIRVELPGGSEARRCAPMAKIEHNPSAQGTTEDVSLQFLAFNRNKRSIVIDPESADDRTTLDLLIARADFVFESEPRTQDSVSTLEAFGHNRDSLQAANPLLIHTRLSAFGEGSPYESFVSSDLVIAAMGGPVALQGPRTKPPVRISTPQVWRHAGVEAAAGALAAHAKMLHSGRGQFVDLSAQSVMTWTMLNAMDAHAIQGQNFERHGNALNNGVLRVEIVHPTKDGYIVALPLSRVFVGLLDWMIEDGVLDESFRTFDWEAYDLHAPDPDNGPMSIEQGVVHLRNFLKKHTKQSLFEFGLKHNITLAPVNTLKELLELPHLGAREYWQTGTLDGAGTVTFPGAWCKPNIASNFARRPAPALDEHGAEIRDELSNPPRKPIATTSTDSERLPFDDIKVADFSWVGVGPISAKYLADHGAQVVRIESENRPDVLRAGGPFKDGVAGWNRSQFYGDFNTSKQSVALDLKNPTAIAIAKQLVAGCDVMIESFAPGAIGRMGLGYEELRTINPGLIMISTCLMGQTGPASQLAGYGYHAGAIAGFYELTGWQEDAPSGPWMAYTDTIAPRFISVLLASAIDHRRRTGEGCYIDVAQLEASMHFLAPELLDLQINAVEATRNGNRSKSAAPQGCYPCAGEDQWCAIAIENDAQWASLCNAMQRPDLQDSSSFGSARQRIAHHDEIDAAIQTWTQTQDSESVMLTLQAVGVPAGKVARSSDLLQDPQYTEREFYRYIDHPEMGRVPYAGHQYRISDYNNGPRAHAPCLGQHSFEVLSEWIGLDDDAIADAYASGAIT